MSKWDKRVAGVGDIEEASGRVYVGDMAEEWFRYGEALGVFAMKLLSGESGGSDEGVWTDGGKSTDPGDQAVGVVGVL